MEKIIDHVNNIAQDETMRKVILQVGECKIGKNKQNIFPYLIGLIVGQKIRFSKAQDIRSKLYTEAKSYNFTPQDIINLTEIQWNKISVEPHIKETIITTTKYFIDQNIGTDNVTKDDIIDLKQIKGIGDWTVSTLLIEYGLDLNLFPLGDKHVNKQIIKLYDITQKEISQFVRKWNPYKSIAFWYLWKYNLHK